MDDYDFFEKRPDAKLVELIISGNNKAACFLIKVRYKKNLYAVIGKRLGEFMKFYDDDLEYYLEKFYDHMIEPKKKTAYSKFGNITDNQKVNSWLCSSCSNFMSKVKKNPASRDIDDEDFKLVQDYDTYDEEEAKLSDERRESLLLWILDFFTDKLSKRDQYIMFTYMYSDNKMVKVSRFAGKIADDLNQCHCRRKDFSEEEVRDIYSRSMRKARNKFEKNAKNEFEKNEFAILLSTI
jgi:hypothetical protein